MVQIAREEKIQIDNINLDSTDKLYPNNTKKMLEEQKSLFNEFGGKWFNLILIPINLFVTSKNEFYNSRI